MINFLSTLTVEKERIVQSLVETDEGGDTFSICYTRETKHRVQREKLAVLRTVHSARRHSALGDPSTRRDEGMGGARIINYTF